MSDTPRGSVFGNQAAFDSGRGVSDKDGVTLLGEIERVTFENQETGFRVLRLTRVEGLKGKKRMTVVGVVPAVGVGTRVRVSGKVENDSRHGERVRAESLVVVAPDTLEGVEKYLSSGVIKGIGPALSKRIVKYFGLETLGVLDGASHRLAEVPGLGRAKVASLREAWASHQQLSNVLLALQAHGAAPALAARIISHFGTKAAEVIHQAPYRLAIEVRGVGFKTADAIARQQGISKDHPERCQAGTLHQLEELEHSGHCYCGRELLRERTAAMLGVDETPIDAAIDALQAATRVVDDAGAIYLTRLHQAETSVAKRVRALLDAPSNTLTGVTAAVERFESDKGFSLAENQRAAVEAAAERKVAIITGGPGVGKTTIVQAILHVVESEHLRIALAAPTGRAAKRLTESTGREATTLHRLLEVNAHTGKFERTTENPLEVDLLIVDEASMIDVRLAQSLFEAIPNAARVVLVGDVDQLPSVGPGAVLCDLIESGEVPVVRLDVIFRQGETSGIVTNSHRIQAGELPEGAKNADGDFFVVSTKDALRAQDLVVQAVTERIPKRFGLSPTRDVQVLTPMHRGDAGTIALNKRLQQELNPTGPSLNVGDAVLRVGDKVLQTRNDYDKGVFNGDVGEVAQVDPEAQKLSVAFEGEGDRATRFVNYERGELIQLQLAYAMSIHKSQGSEYPAVVIPFLTAHFVMLSRNLLYTAVTRGKKLCLLVADQRALRIALGETRKEERSTGLAARVAQL